MTPSRVHHISESNPSPQKAHEDLVLTFTDTFGCLPTHAATAPGRVNLIGEHTDYNDGFVLPMAIDRRCTILARRRHDQKIRVRSTSVDGELLMEAGQSPASRLPTWTNYIRGPIAIAAESGFPIAGFDALIHSTIPPGGGLSSSAALEVGTLTLVEALAERQMDPLWKALGAQRAESEFAGVPCGIMDQFASAMGKKGHALLIDCRKRSTRYVALDDPAVGVLIINSNRSHELNGGEYAERRGQCEDAARAMHIDALRDATSDTLESARHQMDPLSFLRARHVVSENQRTLEAADALDRRDYDQVGRLMFASHDSLRDDFEVSTPQLDQLVELARSHSKDGVIGSRMTGGGFGGCTVTLAYLEHIDEIMADILGSYFQATGIEADAFVAQPSAGASILNI